MMLCLRLLCCVLAATLCAATGAQPTSVDRADNAPEITNPDHGGHGWRKPITVKLIGLNDFHGNLQSPGTFGVNLAVPPEQRPLVAGADTWPDTSPA
jgi:hypothetical protein